MTDAPGPAVVPWGPLSAEPTAMPDFPLPNASFDLSGQVALVTGASSGLGHRFARVLAAAGATVAVAARRTDRLDALVQTIRAAGGRAEAFALDVTQDAQFAPLFDAIEARLGASPGILVNNAGIPDAQRAHKMAVADIDRVLSVNLRAPWLLSCEFARRRMAAQLPGRIVNIASMAAFQYKGGGAALYATTKMAVVRMSEALAVEWAKFGINVNAIAPGAFASEMMDGMLQRVGDITQNFPRPRLGDPAQMDSTLLYLVSPASEFVTGTTIRIDDAQGGR
ncbi:3-oxoacyl-ACP reductase [Rubrivivax pictus]|uniref:3-oxoacyl-ACP reductase n=2 Tax=Pseudaquabacterium pictum TaxID=2315236 RepID=A0A480AX63_9BURK|nr:3-oxoacyl-ACP reductase [Rubrivivax pictus]